MKSSQLIPIVLSILVATPTLVSAQMQAVPVRVAAASKAEMPKAQELLDNLFAPYAAAKTFSGNFDIEIKGDDSKVKITEMHVKTRYSYDEKGDLQGEDSVTRFVGASRSGQQTELRIFYNGATNIAAFPDKKLWWQKTDSRAETELTLTLKPLLNSIAQLFRENDVVPIISKGKDAGRPVWILKIKDTNDFRVVVDQQSRALRLIELKDSLSIRGSEQTFDALMTDNSFVWSVPADYAKIEESEAAALFPEFMKDLISKPAAPAATPTK